MSYIEEIFNRLNIQQIREFLTQGIECEPDPKDYKERIEEAKKRVKDIIGQKHPDIKEYEDIMGIVFHYSSTCEDVYMEIGLQCGFILAVQMFSNTGLIKK